MVGVVVWAAKNSRAAKQSRWARQNFPPPISSGERAVFGKKLATPCSTLAPRRSSDASDADGLHVAALCCVSSQQQPHAGSVAVVGVAAAAGTLAVEIRQTRQLHWSFLLFFYRWGWLASLGWRKQSTMVWQYHGTAGVFSFVRGFYLDNNRVPYGTGTRVRPHDTDEISLRPTKAGKPPGGGEPQVAPVAPPLCLVFTSVSQQRLAFVCP